MKLYQWRGLWVVGVFSGSLALTGCGVSGHEAKAPSTHSPVASAKSLTSPRRQVTRSAAPSKPPDNTVEVKLGRLVASIPKTWIVQAPTATSPWNKEIKATHAGVTMALFRDLPSTANVYQLLPQEPKPAGLTETSWNDRPFFTEDIRSGASDVDAAVGNMTVAGTDYSVIITAPPKDSKVVRALVRALKLPQPATVTQDVHLLMTKPTPQAGMPLATTQAGASSGWVLAGGQPATAQEPFFLYRTRDSGKRWVLLKYTDFSATPPEVFPDTVGTPAMLFWSAQDGLIVQPSFAGPRLRVYRTVNGGNTWTMVQVECPALPDVGQAPEISRLASGVMTLKVHLAAGQVFQVESRNNGQNWTAA